MDTPKPLSPRARRFVEEYIVDLSATQAAIRAGYSPRAAHNQGSRLMGRADVQAAIAAAQATRSRRTEITADRVVEELARVAFFDLATVAKGEGAVEHVAKIKTADKLRALEALARHLGMYRDRVEVSGPGGGPVTLSMNDRAERVQALLSVAAARMVDDDA